jgi:hypothetical protein
MTSRNQLGLMALDWSRNDGGSLVMTLIESAQSCSVKLLTGDRRLL